MWCQLRTYYFVAVVRANGEEQVDEANTKEQGNHKRTTTKTIDLESAAASVGHRASLCVERDLVESLMQTQRIQIPSAYRDDLSMRKLAEATSQRHQDPAAEDSELSDRVGSPCQSPFVLFHFILFFSCLFWSCQILPSPFIEISGLICC
jgi:hypothetical protein